jgi:hypothetical protein
MAGVNNDARKVSYFRTLIFTVFAAVFSLGLFAILFIEGGKQFLPFVVTVEIGLFLIIAYCIWLIVVREKFLDNQKDPKNYNMKFDICPDYYIKRYDETKKKFFCSNEYTVVDKKHPSTKSYTMKIVRDTMSLPSTHSSTYMTVDPNTSVAINPETWDKFFTDTLYDTSLKTDRDRCKVVDPSVSPVPGDKFGDGFKKVPWTYVRTRCDGLYGTQT